MRPLPTHLSDLLAQSSDRKGARDMTVAVVLGCGLQVQTLKHSITWVQTHGWQHSGTQNHRGTDTWAATLEHRITRIQTHWLQHSRTQHHMGTDTLATTLWNTVSHGYRHIDYNTLGHRITWVQTHWLKHWNTASHGYRHMGYNAGTKHHMGTDTLAATLWNTENHMGTDTLATTLWNTESHGYRHTTLWNTASHGYRHTGCNTLEHRITQFEWHVALTKHHMGTDTLAATLWNTENHMGTDTLATKLWNTESHGYRHTGYNSGTQHHTGTDTLAATHGPKVLLLRHKNRLTPPLPKNLCCKPVWPSGKVLGWEAEEFHFGSPFSSKVVVCGHCLVTLSHN